MSPLSRFVPTAGTFLVSCVVASLCVGCEPEHGTSDPPPLPTRSGSPTCAYELPEFVMPALGQWSEADLATSLQCRDHADCGDRPRGYCEQLVHSPMPATRCVYACISDEDCGEGEVCDCGSDVGRCVPASCRGPEDCGGAPCARFDEPSVCLDGYLGAGIYYDCLSDDAECQVSEDCADGEVCSGYDFASLRKGSRRCQEPQLCGI